MQSIDISIISFNTLGVPFYSQQLTERYVTMADIIKTKYDETNILAFQEVHTYIHLYLLQKVLKSFPHISYAKGLYGPKGGLVIFSKLPIASQSFRSFKSKGTFSNITFYGKFIQNGILCCRLKDTPVCIFNTYLTTNPNSSWIPKDSFIAIQQSQVNDLIQTVKARVDDNEACIVAGDFNFTKDSDVYKQLLNETNAKNVFEKFSLPTYLYDRRALKFLWRIKFLDRFFLMNAKESGQVDFIFLIDPHNHCSIKDNKYILDEKVKLFNGKENYLSDHIGLYTKLSFEV